MTPTRWQRQSKLFEAAVALPLDQRDEWLDEACAGDAQLRAAIAQMLQADSSDFERAPAAQWLSWAQSRHWHPGQPIGAYQIVRKLGSGGMGEVYLAERSDNAVVQQVAIKRLHGDAGDPEAERRFLNERRFLARLQHPNIARFLDAGTDPDGMPYAVMEYIPGQSITGYARAQGLSIEQRLALFLKVADAVSYAHRQLIVHRDIKPANVLIDAQGEPRLLDFGISKQLDRSTARVSKATLTAFEFRAFSLQYAAPEQLRGEPCGISCDIYALGTLLYELLTDVPPLAVEGLSFGEAERHILDSVPSPPSRQPPPLLKLGEAAAWRKRLQGDLDRIILHTLKKAADQRYLSVDALCADLRAHLAREAISLRVHHRWYRIGRFCGRHRLPLALVAALLLLMTASSLLLLQQSLQMKAERDTAQVAQARAESATALLVRAFEGADPSRHEGKQLSARAVLEFAARDLALDREMEPRLRAEIGTTVAEVRRSLGEPQGALDVLGQSAGAIDQLPDELACQMLKVQAETQLDLGDLEAAARTLTLAQQRLAAIATSERRDPLAHELGLIQARLLAAQGRPEQTLDLLQGLYGQPLAAAHSALNLRVADAFAGQLSRMGQRDRAAKIHEQVLQSIPDPDTHYIGRRVLNSLARWHRSRGELELALEFADRYLASTRLLYGEQHRDYATALDLHARIAADAGLFDLADREFRASMALLESAGTEGARRAQSLAHNNYADFLLKRAQPAAALKEAEAALALASELYPSDHLNIGFIAYTLGETLLANSRPAEAYAALQRAEAIYARFDKPDRPGQTRAQTQLLLARAAADDQRPELARSWLRQALPVLKQGRNQEHAIAAAALARRLDPDLATQPVAAESVRLDRPNTTLTHRAQGD